MTDAKQSTDGAQHIVHPLEPVFDARSRVLILGTMPSPVSRQVGFYYGHPQNRFWPTLAALFDESLPQGNDERTAFALRHGIALWDVLASCTIVGASDASIRDAEANDLSRIFDAAPIERVFTTGTKASALYAKLCEPLYGRPAIALPSPSAANARMRLDDLVEAYRVIQA